MDLLPPLLRQKLRFSPKNLLATACVMVAPLAVAHEGEHASVNLPEQTVKAEQQEFEESSNTNKVDVARLQKTLAKGLRDVFVTEPSVQVGSGTRNGQKIMLRGVEDLNLNIQIDGARQGANTFHHQGRVQIDPYLYKQISVDTGPAAADVGPGALGGSVRFETVDAQDMLIPGHTSGARLGAQWEDKTRTNGRIASAYTMLTDSTGLLGYVRTLDSGTSRDGNGERIRSTDGDNRSYLFKVSMLENEGHSLRLAAERNTNAGGTLRANMPWQTGNANQANDDQESFRDTLTLNHRYQPAGQNLLDLETTLYQNVSRLEWYRDSGDLTFETRSLGGSLRNTWRFHSGPIQHALTAGFDHFHDSSSQWNSSTHYNERALNNGVFIQNRLQWGPVRVSLGARGDFYDTQYANGASSQGEVYSPNATIEWDPLAEVDLTLFAGYGESARGAKLNQSGWLQKYSNDFRLGEKGHLKPEYAQQRQLGVRWHDVSVLTPGDHLGLSWMTYNTHIRDYQIVPGEGSGLTDHIHNASSAVRSRGYELSGHWGLENVLLSMAYSHNVVRNWDGQPMDTSGNSARVGVSTGDRLVVDANWNFMPAFEAGYTLTAVKRLSDVPVGRPDKPGYAVHNLRLGWSPLANRDTLQVNFVVENLFDKQYADHTTVRTLQASDTATAVAGQQYANWEPGRTFKVSADWFF